MKEIKLTKISELKNPLHSNNIPEGDVRIGTMEELPKVGQSFIMPFVTSINKKGALPGTYFYTSIVTKIINDSIFETLNSVYKIEILKDTVKLMDIL